MASQEETVTSPNGKLAVTLTVGPAPALIVTLDGRTVAECPDLGLTLAEGARLGGPLGDGLVVKDGVRKMVDESYDLVCGKRKRVRNRYNEMTLAYEEKAPPHRTFSLVLRAYDDGAAFRYVLPVQEGLETAVVMDENTRFSFPDGAEGWLLDLGKFTTAYETNYREAPLAEVGPKNLLGLPLLVKVDDATWAAVTEADLRGFTGLYLSGEKGSPGTLAARLAPLPGNKKVKARIALPFASPWRVIMAADSPCRLIESDIVTSLCPPQAIEDASWIKPGKAAWDWWSGQRVAGGKPGAMDTDTILHYVDFAAENGLEYMLIDAEWYGKHNDPDEDITTPIAALDLPRVMAHAREKNVGILLWLYWRCLEKQMDAAFSLYGKWGVAGVKVDYMNRDDQEMVAFYERVVKKAAEHRLLVNFHGAYKPTGLRRTWPNLITREGALGLEYSKWSADFTPRHGVTLPFTRMLAGPMDCTPGAFRTLGKDTFKPVNPPAAQGTRCHQLAMYVVFESPLQFLPDYPDAYRGGTGLEFLKDVPATWDDTRALAGEPGRYIVMARRSGKEWFVGAMTDWEARDLRVPLDFLGEGGYAAEIYSDPAGEDADLSDAEFDVLEVERADTLGVRLAPGGGCAVRIYPLGKR